MQGRCYKFFSTKLNWNAAKSACEALGSELVIINSQAEQQAIRAIIKQKIWIGLYRDPKDKNSFLWVDGSRPSYTNWGAGEPNNHNGNEDCTDFGTIWNDLACRTTNPYVCETYVSVQKCSNLELNAGRLVKISPSSCVTSKTDVNTTCSFSCPQGYQLQGPSYKQCGADGYWTDSAKPVSCPDIDECAASNGGCSHKCVNTAGGYKCECPNPGLSLSSDKRTCHTTWSQVNTAPLCFGAKDRAFGAFNIPFQGNLAAIRLVNLYGYVSCDTGNKNHWSYWGCGTYNADDQCRHNRRFQYRCFAASSAHT
ncbi:hypothetical protein ACROYT_G039981 [Oculina patagonica]